MLRFLSMQTVTFALLVTPLFGGNDKNFTYLALGDSIAFGFDPTLLPTTPNQPLPAPDQFIGYPEIVAQIQHLPQSKKGMCCKC